MKEGVRKSSCRPASAQLSAFSLQNRKESAVTVSALIVCPPVHSRQRYTLIPEFES